MARTVQVNVKIPKGQFDGELEALLFNRGCCLVARGAVKDGKAKLEIEDKSQARNARLFIAPRNKEARLEEPTIERLERLRAFEHPFDLERPQIDILIPQDLLPWWQWCLCWIRGRVVRVGDDLPGPLPVCGARVHVCEVDPWPLILRRLDDYHILRLRDELIPELHPGPLDLGPLDPPLPDPPPFRPTLTNPTRPIRPIGGLTPGRVTLGGGDPFPLGNAPKIDLPRELHNALISPSVPVIREALLDHLTLIRPWLCWWPWIHPFLRCDELFVLETDAQGRFSRLYGYPCPGDRPDLYFWVEVKIGGVWETVYRPPLRCNIYWNYACGHEVTLRVSDRRVVPCGEPQDLPGRQVVVLSIGNNVSIDEIPQTGDDRGRANGVQAFGGRLEPRVDFGRTALFTPDPGTGRFVKYYRWSYRKVANPGPGGGSVSDNWHIMSRNVVRHYRQTDPGTGNTSYLPYPLGPQTVGTEDGLCEIQPINPPPNPTEEWVVVDAHEDLASAHFQTTQVAGASAAVQAGYYELKLELFDDQGTRVVLRDLSNPSDPKGIDLKVTNVPAPFGQGAVSTRTVNRPGDPTTWDAALVHIQGGDVMGFRMLVQVDNNPCTGQIKPIASVPVNGCGFAEFPANPDGSPNPAGRTVRLAFEAGHPNGFGNFSFDVRRGSGGNILSLSGNVTDATATGTIDGSPITFSKGGSGNYEGNPTIASLVTAGCGYRAAFSEALYVNALITDGWGDLDHLDRSDHDAFALAPEQP
jgi:hypothetical protein